MTESKIKELIKQADKKGMVADLKDVWNELPDEIEMMLLLPSVDSQGLGGS